MTASTSPSLAQTAHLAAPQDLAFWNKLVSVGGDLAVNLAVAALIVVATAWAAKWLSKLTLNSLHGRHRHAADQTLKIFLSSLVRNVIYILGAIAVLQQLGVKTTSILAALGAASLAIGLALQGALSNVAAGVMILILRPYRVDDIVDTGGRTGTVKSIDLFVTELATLDNLKVVIPNAKVFGDVIVNHTFHDKRRADTLFRVTLAADASGIMGKLRQWLETDPRVLHQPPPLIEITSVSESSVEIAVRPWAAKSDYGPVKADLLMCARLLQADPQAALPAPSSAPTPTI